MLKNLLFPVIASVLLILLVEPFGFMPPMYFMTVLVAVTLVLAFVFALAWRERPRDEREEVHTHFADRLAYLIGALVLLLALAVGGFRHDIDPWIVFALIAMILSKSFALLFKERRG